VTLRRDARGGDRRDEARGRDVAGLRYRSGAVQDAPGQFPWPLTEPAVPVSSFDLRFLQVRLDDRYHHDPTWLPSRPAFDGTGRIVNFSDSASIDLHRVDAVIAGHKDAEMIGLQGVFGRARSVT